MYLYETLLKNELFSGLQGTELKNMLEAVGYKRRIYKKNDIIFHQGDKADGIFFLLKGNVRGEMSNHSGKVIKIEDVESGKLLAPAFVFGTDKHFPVYLIASCETECLYMTRHSLLRLLMMNEKVLLNFLNLISDRAQFLTEKIRFIALQNLQGKIAMYLLQKAEISRELLISIPYSQRELAELFGVTRPSLARSLHELENMGLIRVNKQEIRILNKRELQAQIG